MDTGLSPVGPLVPPHSNAATATSTTGTDSTSLSAWLESRGLATPPSTLPVRLILPREQVRDVGVQMTDPRVIAPEQYITYRQTWTCTLDAASHLTTLLTVSTSLDAKGLANQTA